MVTELGVDRAGVAAAVLENTRMMYEYSHDDVESARIHTAP